jgi:hypothetical protein
MPGRSAPVTNERRYEALVDDGMSKERAARVANSVDASRHGGEHSHAGRGSASLGRTSALKKAAGRQGRKGEGAHAPT